MGTYGPPCTSCGHPSVQHTTSKCLLVAGSERKERCDCKGYNVAYHVIQIGWLLAHFAEWHPDHDLTQCLDVARGRVGHEQEVAV